ncbi:MAG: STAS domain-containing protein [Thermoanaerobaculia bacterium]
MQETHTFKIEVSRDGDARIVEIHGALADDATSRAKEAFLQVLNENPRKILVDLSQLDYISSSGIGLLVSVLRRCRQRGISLPVCSLRPDIFDLFRLTRLHQVFEIFDDRAAALRRP